MNKKKEKEISEYLGLMLWPGFCRRWRQRRRAEGERESREMVKQGTEMRKTKKKRKWAPLNKKNNIRFTIGKQCGLKYEIALFINCKNYTI